MTTITLDSILDTIKTSNDSGAAHSSEHLTGLSGEALFGTLQRLSSILLDENTVYLEVGVYQGLTLLSSALANSNSSFYGIDNFAYFDPENKNKSIVLNRIKKLDVSNVHLIDQDYEDALENLEQHIGNKKVGVYFIDGPHDYRSQLMCLQLIKPYLADNAVILIDDSNYRFVRQANRDFLITHPDFKFIYESYTPAHPANMTPKLKSDAYKGWWNGINIIGKGELFAELNNNMPHTLRDRTIFENEQVLHATKYPEHVHSLVQIATKFNLFKILNLFKKPSSQYSGGYKHANTYSENLPINKMNTRKDQNSYE